MTDREKSIAAWRELSGKKIIIECTADFTPPGKRRVRIVQHALNGKKCQPRIGLYVALPRERS